MWRDRSLSSKLLGVNNIGAFGAARRGAGSFADHRAIGNLRSQSRAHPKSVPVKVAAYQAPLLPSGSMGAVDLIRQRIAWCEVEGVEILCCPEAVLGGLADYAAPG
jgi:hypothetical protein